MIEQVNHPKHYNSHPSGVECIGEICRLSGLPAYVGGNRCKHCPCNDGYVDSCSFGVEHWQDFDGSYIRCKHSEAKDSENIGGLLGAYYDFIRHRALCALCY